MAARASMAVSTGSGAAVAITHQGSSPSAPSSSEEVSPFPDAAIDILSWNGAPNEMLSERKGEIAAKSCSYANNRCISYPLTYLQRVGGPDTEENARVRHPQTGNDSKPRGNGRNGILKKTRPSGISSFRICSFS